MYSNIRKASRVSKAGSFVGYYKDFVDSWITGDFMSIQSNHFRKVSPSFGESRGEEKTFIFKTQDFSNLN
jgi:hypothetical protein